MIWQRLGQKQLYVWKRSYWLNSIKEHLSFIIIMFFLFIEYIELFICKHRYFKYGLPKKYPTWWLEERTTLAILFAIILLFVAADFIFRQCIKRKSFLMGVDRGIILYSDEKHGKFTIRIPKNLEWQLDAKTYNSNNLDEIEESIFDRFDFTYYDYETYSYP